MAVDTTIWEHKYRAMASKVLIVLSINHHFKEWSCFIDAVAGINHDKEYEKVGQYGSLVPKKIAKIYFSDTISRLVDYVYVSGW